MFPKILPCPFFHFQLMILQMVCTPVWIYTSNQRWNTLDNHYLKTNHTFNFQPMLSIFEGDKKIRKTLRLQSFSNVFSLGIENIFSSSCRSVLT